MYESEDLLIGIESILDLDALGRHRLISGRSTRLVDDRSSALLGRLCRITTG